MTLAAIVVFTTTYAMILPALSMDVVVAQQDSGIGLESEDTTDFSSEAQTDADTGTGSAGQNTDTGEAQTPTAADTDSAATGTEPETDDDFSTEEPAVVEQQTTADAAASTLTAEIPGATVTLAFDAESGVPEGTILTVTALTQEEAGAYRNAAQEKADASVSGSNVTTAQFYRLALTHDGETVTPVGDADIHVDYTQNPYLEQDETAYAVVYTGEASSYHTLLLSRNSDGTATVAANNGAITAADLKDYSISRYGDVFGIVSVKAPAAENGDEAGADDNAAADTTEDTAAEAEKNSKETVDAADDIDTEEVNDNLAAEEETQETDAAAEEGNTAEDKEAAEEKNASGDAAEAENTIEDENAGEEKDAAEEVAVAADETDAQDADSQDTEKESEDFDAPESQTEEDTQAGLTELDLGDVVIRPVDEELLLPADTEGHAEVLEGTEAAEAQSAVEEFVNAQNAPKASKMKKAAKRQTLAATTATADQNEQAYQVFDIALENVDTEEYKGGFEVEVSLPENIIGKDFHLYHIHEGETEEIAFDLDERVLDEESGVSVVSGFTFETANFSEFVLKYTVEYTTDNNEVTVKLDFTDIVKNGVDFDTNSVITALNDGVSVSIPQLEQGYIEGTDSVVNGELYMDYTTADNKNENIKNVNWIGFNVVSADEGLTVADGKIKVTKDGTVVLSDGISTVTVVISNYEKLVAKELTSQGVDITVLNGEVPAGSTATYTALDDGHAADLVSTYNIEETKTDAVIENHNILDSASGYTAFDVTIKQPEGDDFTDAGVFAVAVEHPVDVERLVPEGAKLVGVNYTLYHIHDGEATAVDGASFVDGKVMFTTESFSEYVLIYTIDFTLDGYTFSYPGKIPFMLSDLLFAVHIDVNAADVADIQFTNNDLFRVEKVEGDWEIEGVQSFTTEEGMILTLVNGEKIYIFATDPVENPTLTLPSNSAGTEMTASVSKAVTLTEQSRNASFKLTVDYELGDDDFNTIKNADGFPVIVYDLNDYLGGTDAQGNPVPIDSLTDRTQPWYDKLTDVLIGQVRVEDNQVIMTITNLDWLSEQLEFGAKFDVQVNIDETKLGTRDEYEFQFPGTDILPPIHFKKLEYQKSKSYQFNQHNDGGKVVMEKEDGQYKIHYTVDLTSPIELDTLNFTDTISGKQKYTGNVTITDPTGKTGTVPTNSGSSSLNIDVKSALGYNNNEKAPAGRYTVTYTTVINEEDLQEVDSTAEVTQETNSATWNVGGENNIDVPPTEFKPYKDREPVNPTKTVSNEQGHDANSWQYGDKLDYTITFGSDKKEMAGIKVYDEMTDLQTLNYPVTITYKDKSGNNKTVTLSANAADGNGVVWNNDGNYGPGMTTILNYTLPADAGKGTVTVTYSTNVISKETAIEKKIYGIQSVKNRVTVNNESKETTGDVTFPDEPKQEKKITASTKDSSGKLVPGSTITYTMTYGSKDIPLKGTTISDEMTELQNLNAGTIKIKYGTGNEQDMPSDWIKWQTVSADQYSEGTATVFEHTFGDEAANIYGPITITYTTTLASAADIAKLDISGDKSVNNTFKVNNNPTSTYESIPTNTPNTVKKTVKNKTTNSNTWKPGDTLEYTIVFEGDRLAGSTITDYATDIQLLSDAGIKLEFYDSTDATATATNTVTLAANSSNIGDDFKDNTTTGYTEVNAAEAKNHFHTDSKLLFTYDVPADSNAKRIVATYTMTILDETFAHDFLDMYGLTGTNNSAETSKGGKGGTNGNTDYGTRPPIPQEKTVSPTDIAGNEGWQPGQNLSYTLTYGDGKKDMRGVHIYDAMTDLQNLTSDITIKFYDAEGHLVQYNRQDSFTMPVSAQGGYGTGQVWTAKHGTSTNWANYTYGTGLTDVFDYNLPSDLPNYGKLKLEITYTTQVIDKATAAKCNVYDLQSVKNNFTVLETVTTEGDVPFEDSPKPKKRVTPEDADTVDTSKAESEGWQPGARLKYTMTFGDKYTHFNSGSISDSMSNVQTMVDESKVLITWNTGYNENGESTGTKSMYMPVGNPGVVWSSNHTKTDGKDNYTVGYGNTPDMKAVFNYSFPEVDDNVTFSDGTTGSIGDVYGPITVGYEVVTMSQEDAARLGLYGLQIVDNLFTVGQETAFTHGDVPYKDEEKHKPRLRKTGYVSIDDGSPVFEAGTTGTVTDKNGKSHTILVPPTGSKTNIDISERRMTWVIMIDAEEGSTYPLTYNYNGENPAQEGITVTEYISNLASFINTDYSGTGSALYSEGLLKAVEARVVTQSGKTLYPGTDYTVSFASVANGIPGEVKYHFDKIDEPVLIYFDAYFNQDIIGEYGMNNRVSFPYNSNNNVVEIKGYNESVSVKKEGEVQKAPDGTNRVIKWTVVLNPDALLVEPDISEVYFTDTLPEGLALIDYLDWKNNSIINMTTPSIHAHVSGRQNMTDPGPYESTAGKTGVVPVEVEENIIQKVDVRSHDWNYANYSTLSQNTYTIDYYTYITDEKWAEITSSESGTQGVVNTATFTDGGTRIFTKTTEVTVEVEEYLSKKDISAEKADGISLESDDLDYLVNVNPHKYMLNDGNPLTLSDEIPTSMNLRVPSIKVFKATAESVAAMQAALDEAGKTEADRSIVMNTNGTLKTELLGRDVTNRVTISYNDDSRVLSFSGLEDEEQYYVFFTAGVRSVGGNEQQTFVNTITLTGKGSHSTTETSTHKTEEFHAEAHGGMGMIKIDEDNAKKTLEGAVFELYEVTTDAVTDDDFEEYTENGQTLERVKDSKGKATTFQTRQIITNTADENGRYTSDRHGVVSFGTFEFDANKLYYWVEKKAPEGYVADLDVPHYFVMYQTVTEDDLTEEQITNHDQPSALTQANMLRAWALDDWWSDSYGITVASYALNATWYATNSQYRSITATKKWEGDSNNIYKLRPQDGVKFTLVRINPDGTTENLDTRVIRGGNENQWPSYTWNKLPIEDDEGNHYKYTVVEEFVENYYPEYSDNGKGIEGGTITVVNHMTPGSTSITVEKLWQTGGEVPQSIKVKLVQIYTDPDGNVVKMASPDDLPSGWTDRYDIEAVLSVGAGNRWLYTWNELPTRADDGAVYSYTVEEIGVYNSSTKEYDPVPTENFIVDYSDDGKGIVKGTITITNIKPGALKIIKKVAVNGVEVNEGNTLADGTYTFNILDEKGAKVKSVKIKVENGVSEPLIVNDLPEGAYTVREEMPTNGTNLLTGTPKEYQLTVRAGVVADAEIESATFTNNRDTTKLTVKKKWYTNTVDWPRGRTAEITLVKNGTALTETDRPDYKVTLTEEQQSYTWTGLDPEATYTISEAPIAGFVAEISEMDENQVITVTNKESTNVDFTKSWDASANIGDKPWTAEVKLMQREKIVVEYDESISGREPGPWTDTGLTRIVNKANPSADLNGLPKYRLDGTTIYEIEYTIKESSIIVDGEDVTNLYAGIVTKTASDETSASFSMVNTPARRVPVEKIWDGDIPSDVASVEFTLLRNGSAVNHLDGTAVQPITLPIVDENGNKVWSAVFEDLPQDGTYTIKETRVTYTNKKSITDEALIAKIFGAVAGGTQETTLTITNKKETLDIPVHKDWQDIDPMANGLTVSFTLYTVNPTTGKETKVTKDADGNSVNATINNVNRNREVNGVNWTTQWINLPRYDENGVEIQYRVRETRVQANGTTYTTTKAIVNNWGEGTWADVEPGEVTEITNKPVKAELVVRKRWSSTIPENAQVTIALLKDGQPVQQKDVVEGSTSTEPFVFTLPKNGDQWYDSITGLQKYDREGNLVQWSVKETQITYDVSGTKYTLYDVLPTGVTEDATHKLISSVYTVQGEGVFSYADGSLIGTQTINNNLPEVHTGSHVDIGLEKVWKDGSKTVVPEGASATFTLHQERLALPAAANQKVVRIYAGDKTTRLHVGVLDSTATNATLEFACNSDQTLTFKYVKTDATAFTAQTSNSSYSGNVSVSFEDTLDANQVLELYVDNKSASDFKKLPYIYNDGSWETEYANNSWTISLTDDPHTNDANNGDWKYLWKNMPQIDESTAAEPGYRYRYYITEDSHLPADFTGFEITDGDTTHKLTDSASVTATNSKPPHLDVTKVWSDGKKEIEPPEDMRKVYFEVIAWKYQNGSWSNPYIATVLTATKVYPDGTSSAISTTAIPGNGKYVYELAYDASKGGWPTISISGLPEDDYGTELVYQVVECNSSGTAITTEQTVGDLTYAPTIKLDGTVTKWESTEDYFTIVDSRAVTITNTTVFPDEVPITVAKAWNNADESHTWPEGVEVEVGLYRVQGKTQTLVEKPDTVEAANWANPATLKNEEGKRTYTWQDVPTKDGDNLIEYIVKETAVTKNNESIVAQYPLQSTVAALTGTTTLTNVEFVDTSLNVKKAWQTNEGTATTREDGTITYELWQNSSSVTSITSYAINTSGLVQGWYGSGSVPFGTTGSNSVKSNGTVTIVLTSPDRYNRSLENNITCKEGLVFEDTGVFEITEGSNWIRKERKLTFTNVNSNITLTGNLDVAEAVRNETAIAISTSNEPQGSSEPVTGTPVKVATVVMSKTGVTKTIESGFSGVTIGKGDEDWSSKIEGLPSKVANGNTTTTYTYYVTETNRPEGTRCVSVLPASAQPKGDVITITNAEPPKGSIVVTKTVLENAEPDTEAVGKAVKIGLFNADQSTADPRTAAIATRTITLASLDSGAVVGGSATFDNLPYGTYYVYEVDAENKAILNNETATVGGIEYTVAQDDATANVNSATAVEKPIKNMRTVVKTGNLKLTKTTDPATSTQIFEFTIKFSGTGVADVKGKTFDAEGKANSIVVDADGKATVRLANRDYVLIKGLPIDLTYTITEGDVVGWTNSVKVNESGSIVADQTTEASFTNIYSEITATPEGLKTLTGRDWNNDTFNFTLTPTGTTLTAIADGEVKMPSGAATTTPYAVNGTATKVSGSGNQAFNFGAITFLEAGTYTFDMVEAKGDDASISYANNTVTVTVTVPAKTNGVFTTAPTITYSNSDTTTGVANNEFVNTYDTSVTTHIEGTKVFTNGTIAAAQFSFTISSTDTPTGSLPTPVMVHNDADGNITFGDMTFTIAQAKTGTQSEKVWTKVYHYKVVEDIPSPAVTEAEKIAQYAIRNNIKYDTNEKIVTVTVTYNEANGKLTATPSTATTKFGFTNEQLTDFVFYKIWRNNGSYESWKKDITVIFSQKVGSAPPTIIGSAQLTSDSSTMPTGKKFGTYDIVGEKDGDFYKFIVSGLPIKSGNETIEYSVVESSLSGFNITYGIKTQNEVHDKTTGENSNKALNGEYIINTPYSSVALPATGGPGTKFYHVFGLAMILFAGAMLLIKRKSGLDLIPENK